MALKIKDCLIHWKKKVERGVDDEKKLDIIRKLFKVPISVEHLQETGIGKIVKQLGKENGKVGEKASILLKKWKDVVSSSSSTPSEKNSKSSGKSTSDKSSSKKCNSPLQKEQNRVTNGVGHKRKSSSESVSKRAKYDSVYDDSVHKVNGNHKVSNNSESKYSASYGEVECSKYVPEDPSTLDDYAYDPLRPEIVIPCTQEYKPTPISLINQIKSQDERKTTHRSEEKKNSSKKYHDKRSDPRESSIKVSKDSSPVETKKKPSSVEKIKVKVEISNGHVSHSKHKDSRSETKSKSEKDPIKAEKARSISDVKSSKKSVDHKSANDKDKSSSKTKSKNLKFSEAEAFTASEVSFEDCLGFNDIVTTKKKKNVKPMLTKPSSSKKVDHRTSHHEKLKTKDKKHRSVDKGDSLKHKSKSSSGKSHSESKCERNLPKELKELPKASNDIKPVDILSTLPEIQPNYRPLPRFDLDYGAPKKKSLSNEEAILFTSSKKDRTAVYSGRRNHFPTEVPSLFEACIRLLMENIEYIDYIGGVPFYLIEPILKQCTPQQLYRLEDYNPYLLDDSDALWKDHCGREFKTQVLQEGETWREMYLRVYDEKDRKLKALTANISASMSKSNPVRQVKLAYVDSVVKPPRDVARRQAKNGTGLPMNLPVKAGPPSKATPRPTAPVVNAAVTKASAAAQPIKSKPKIAPLMAKTLKAMKSYRR